MSTQPNLLFVFADQMRGMDMGCAGNPQVRTPHLDRLAAQGTRFAHAYANCAVCTPSRGTILTGRYPHAHGAIANDVPMATGQDTIAHVLGRAGYRTGYIGKWHLDGVPRNRFTPPGPRRQGFDDFWAVWNCAHAYLHGKLFLEDGEHPLELDDYEPIGQTNLALDFLAADDDRPFCLYLSWGPPHAPYDQVPDRYKALYDADTAQGGLDLRPNVRSDPPPGFNPLRGGLDRQAIAGYYAHITAIDEQLGRLLDALDTHGLADNTIVVFTSDHGDMLWSQGMQKKEQPWEEAVNIPMLVRWPGRVPAARQCDALVSTADFVPTLLAMAAQPAPDTVQGADLSPIVLGADEQGPSSVFLTAPIIVDQGERQGVREWRGVRTATHTYAQWFDGNGWVLYDNEADPYQMNNLIDSPEHAPLRAMLEAELQKWLNRSGDACLPWQDTVRALGLVDLWNEREHVMHPKAPRLVDA